MADSITHTTPEDDARFCVGGLTLDAQTLIDTVPGAVFCCLYDEALTLLYTSDSFLEMTGYSREELMLMPALRKYRGSSHTPART